MSTIEWRKLPQAGRISWLLTSSSFAYSFGFMSRATLYRRLDRAAELAGRGPEFFSGWTPGRDDAAVPGQEARD